MGNTVIKDYEVLSELGHGAFGKVYKVKKEGRLFAMKEIVPQQGQQKHIRREIDSHVALPKHVNVVRFFESFIEGKKVGIVLEFCSGGTLNDYIVKNNVPAAVLKSFMTDMARGIEHLHKNDIVHRDIKPENVLLVPGQSKVPRCKISDLGLARFCYSENPASSAEMYYMTSGVGTKLFIAPEVLSGHYTKGCDIFSLGVVFCSLISPRIKQNILYPLLAKNVLFCYGTNNEISSAIVHMTRNTELRRLLTNMLYCEWSSRVSAGQVLQLLLTINLSSPGSIQAKRFVSSNQDGPGGLAVVAAIAGIGAAAGFAVLGLLKE